MPDDVIEKVVIYITHGDRLLIFQRTEFPQAGKQVPAGTVKRGEDLGAAGIREASEETGIAKRDLVLRRSLGSDGVRAGEPNGSRVIRRHVFHVEFAGSAPETWTHDETDPSDGS